MEIVSPENFAEGFRISKIYFFDDSNFGSGEFVTTILGQIFLANKATNNIFFNPPAFQISLKVDPTQMKIFVLLGRIDGAPPLSTKQFIIPIGLDLSHDFTFKVKFLDWDIKQAWINGVPLREINDFFHVSPSFKGNVTPLDFLKCNIPNRGTGLLFWAKLPINGIIFRISYKNFIFQLFGKNQNLILQRNDDIISISSNEYNKIDSLALLGIYWEPELILLNAIINGVQIKKEKNTLSTTLPFELLDVLEKEQKSEIIEYDSEESFRQKLQLLLQNLQDNIDKLSTKKFFIRTME